MCPWRLVYKHGNGKRNYPYVRMTLREASRLLIEIHKLDSNVPSFEAAIIPANYQTAPRAAQQVGGCELNQNKNSKPS